jgi:hypothetical protein
MTELRDLLLKYKRYLSLIISHKSTMKDKLIKALNNPIWLSHRIGNTYTMDGKDVWKIAYYPIFEDGKTGKEYSEPRALIERPAVFKGVEGIDFREIPLRYLKKINNH